VTEMNRDEEVDFWWIEEELCSSCDEQ